MKVEGLRAATNGVSAYRREFEKAVLESFREGSNRITAWEKSNHPWRNRTTQAEQKIKCTAFREGNKIIMENAHYAIDPRTKFKYGIALELWHERRFAILQTALRRWWSWTLQQVEPRMGAA